MDRKWRVHSMSAARAACLAFAMLLALPLVLPTAAPAGSAAEVPEEELGPDGAFNNGLGSARGTGLSVGPSRSGFNFTTDFAISLTDYQNTVARADSRAMSLGAILEAVWDGFDEDNEHGPDNLRTDSRDEDAADGISRSQWGNDPGGPFAAMFGSQYVRADTDPIAEAETAMTVFGFPEAFLIENGHSWSQSGVVAEGQREAHGTASFERIVLGDGQVVLEGLEWEAIHRSGEEDLAEASFTLGNLYIDGEPAFPGEEGDGIGELFDAANEALAEAGITLAAPEAFEDERTGEIRVTPMRIALGSSDLSRAVAGPFSDIIQPIREPLADALIEMDDSFGAVFLLFDVGLGAFAGGGELLLEVGGARAHTGFQEFDNPFGDAGGGFGDGFGELPDEPQPESIPDTSDTAGDGPVTQDLGGPSGSPEEAAGEAPALETGDEPTEEPVDEPVASAPPEQAQQEELAAPAGTPAPSGGQALTAALAALLVAAGLGGVDFLRLRQAQRTIPG